MMTISISAIVFLYFCNIQDVNSYRLFLYNSYKPLFPQDRLFEIDLAANFLPDAGASEPALTAINARTHEESCTCIDR